MSFVGSALQSFIGRVFRILSQWVGGGGLPNSVFWCRSAFRISGFGFLMNNPNMRIRYAMSLWRGGGVVVRVFSCCWHVAIQPWRASSACWLHARRCQDGKFAILYIIQPGEGQLMYLQTCTASVSRQLAPVDLRMQSFLGPDAVWEEESLFTNFWVFPEITVGGQSGTCVV